MKKINGFTLIEVISVTLIVGVLAAIALPSFNGFINAGRARDAQNTLLAIYAGQLNHQAKSQNYCVGNPCVSGDDCTTAAGLSACLSVSILSNNINYSCTDPGGGSFQCTADVGPGLFTLTLNNAQINLTPSGAPPGNPSCLPLASCPGF